MAHPLVYRNKVFFYPIGNTSAVCLTDTLAPEEPANILLLGCGDPRNILFTAYSSGADTSPRRLDFTCCDIEPAILARNAILFSMIIDDVPNRIIWDSFFHFKIDKEALLALLEQCRKLLNASESVETWNRSTYGAVVRMCTKQTMADLRRHWSLYVGTEKFSSKEKQRFEAMYVAGMKPIDGNITTSTRSAGPFWLDLWQISPDSYRRFWKSGAFTPPSSSGSSPRCCNPTYAYSLMGEGFRPHYGSEPLLGFHLAPAVVALKGSPTPAGETLSDRVVRVVKTEFEQWCTAFKGTIGHIAVRLFAGDALALCHAMHPNALSSRYPIYTSPWSSTPLVLDIPDPLAPGVFNVVDTSNLSDHTGMMNLMVSVVPILARGPSTTFYTETLLHLERRPEDVMTEITERTFMSLPMLSLLLGITPVSYLSSFTARSNTHEMEKHSSPAHTAQFHERIGWKIAEAADGNREGHIIEVEPDSLARCLSDIYVKMFEDENYTSVVHFTRGTMARFLKLVKDRTRTKWDNVMGRFLDLVIQDKKLMMGMHLNHQDLRTALHFCDVYPATDVPPIPSRAADRGPFERWTEVPSLICVALMGERSPLKILDDRVEKIGTPMLLCQVNGTRFENAFSDINIVYGTLRAVGADAEKRVVIDMDQASVHVVVFFWMPSWILTKDPRSISISLAVRSSPATSMALLPRLGPYLTLLKANLFDSRVHVLKEGPGVCEQPASARPTSTNPTASFVVANLSDPLTLTSRISVDTMVEEFQRGAAVVVVQSSSYGFEVSWVDHRRAVTFPFPMLQGHTKIRIARKSCYIEVEAQLAVQHGRISMNPFIVNVDGAHVNPWNIHRVNLDRSPALSRPLPEPNRRTLNSHLRTCLSSRENELRDTQRDPSDDALVNVRETIQGIMGKMASSSGPLTFTLDAGEEVGGVNTFLFMTDLRLDLASHTFILDGFVLPVTDEIMSLTAMRDQFLPSVGRDLLHMRTTGNEWKAWKQLLPALVERCRTWEHNRTCEYGRSLPVSMKANESPLCSCGRGKGANTMKKIKKWKPIAPWATPLAVSPLFSVSYFDMALAGKLAGPVPPVPKDVAARCAQCSSEKGTLKACSVCRKVKYCSAACQKEDWKAHRKVCNK